MDKERRIDILECTLRDGSYAVDFQFTPEDTTIIAQALEKAGFHFIEIGHGLGLNASNRGEGAAAATDKEYLKAASSVLKKARFGMFFIPGIGKEQNLHMAADYGMGFVRIGTNATQALEGQRYIRLAKRLGLLTFSNLMKSYSLPPDELAEKARMVKEFGADGVYLVDSAGGMFPADIKEYIEAIKAKAGKIRIGLHAHNNLSMAVANTLTAFENGATIADSTLQGIGRSAGNTPTEILVLVLKKLGYKLRIDEMGIMNLGEKIIHPMLRKAGFDPIEMTSGYALFHSKFLKNINRMAARYDLDPRSLIIEASKESLVELPEEVIAGVAKRLKRRQISRKRRPSFKLGLKHIKGPVSSKEKIKHLALELFSLSKKTGKKSIFVISTSRKKKEELISPFIREDKNSVTVNCEISSLRLFNRLLKGIDGIVDMVLIDADKKIKNVWLVDQAFRIIRKSSLATYMENDIWAKAVDSLISQVMGSRTNLKVALFGCNSPSLKLALKLLEKRMKVTIWDEDLRTLRAKVEGVKAIYPEADIDIEQDRLRASSGRDLLIGFTIDRESISKQVLENINSNGLVIDAGIGTISPAGIRFAIERGLKLYRVDMRIALSAEISSGLDTKELMKEMAGRDRIGGVAVIAGGFIGKKGEVVVDSIYRPTKVLGVADGKGSLIKDARGLKRYSKSVEKVERAIIKSLIT